MSTDTFPKSPLSLSDRVVRVVRARTNPMQLGARRIDCYPVVEDATHNEIDDALEDLVDDGAVTTVKRDGTVYYRLADDRHT